MDNYKFTFWEGFAYHFTHETGFKSHIKCDEEDCNWDTGTITGTDNFIKACKYYCNRPCPECGTLTPVTKDELDEARTLIGFVKFVYPFLCFKNAIKYLFNSEYRHELRTKGSDSATLKMDTKGMREGKSAKECMSIERHDEET